MAASTTVPMMELSADDAVAQVARIVHEANRAFCESIGDTTQVPWDQAPPTIAKSAISGVRAMLANPNITSEELHDAWMKERLADGWVKGDVKDVEKKTHPSLVPYGELSANERFKDALFRGIVLARIQFEA